MAVSYEQLEAMKDHYFSSKEPEGNPFTAKNIVDYNIGGLRTNQFGRLQIEHYLEFSWLLCMPHFFPKLCLEIVEMRMQF